MILEDMAGRGKMDQSIFNFILHERGLNLTIC